MMKKHYKVVRTVLVALLALAFLLPATFYVLLSLPAVQRDICGRVEQELTRLTTMPVTIRELSLTPFNRATVHDVVLLDERGDTAIFIKRLGAGLNLRHLLSRRLVFNHAELIGLDARLSRDSIGAPLNIQPLIDALKPKEPQREKKHFEFAINTVVIRSSTVSYDILNRPRKESGRFDPNHIRLHDLRADAILPRMANDDFHIDLRRLAVSDASGIALKSLSGLIVIKDKVVSVEQPVIELARSVLKLGNISLDTSLLGNKALLATLPIDFQILEGSHIAASDFAPFMPQLADTGLDLYLQAAITGTPKDLNVEALSVSDGSHMQLDLSGSVANLLAGPDSLALDIPEIRLSTTGDEAAAIAASFATLSPMAATILSNLGATELTAGYTGSLRQGDISGSLISAPGRIDIDATFDRIPSATMKINGDFSAVEFDCSKLFDETSNALRDLGETTLNANVDLAFRGNMPEGHIDLSVPTLTYRGYTYSDISAMADVDGSVWIGEVNVDDPGVKLALNVGADTSEKERMLSFTVAARNVNLQALNLVANTHGRNLSVVGEAMLSGHNIDDLNGYLTLNDLAFVDASGNGLKLDELSLEANSDGSRKEISLQSDILEGSVTGEFSFRSIPDIAKRIVENVFPNLLLQKGSVDLAETTDHLDFELKIKDTAPLEGLMSLPVKVIHPVELAGAIDGRTNSLSLNLDAPYLQQGNKIIEQTSLRAGLYGIPGSIGRANLYATSFIPTKNGPMTVAASSFGTGGQLDSHFSWHINRQNRYNGDINLTTRFERDDDRKLTTLLRFNPSDIVINDTVWNVRPSVVEICGKHIDVSNFKVERPGQSIAINGQASESPDDRLKLVLDDIDLDYVFETLGIENAMFGGRATGDFFVSSLFSPNPVAYTPRLLVKGMKYNHSLLGDADIKSSWDNEKKSINIDARIDQPNGGVSYIDGRILPTKDSLDFTFDADRIAIGFLKPFMAAFATNVSGYASGKARLWGTFKLIDMVGDIYGQDVSLTLGFTNTTYTTTDSVRLTPGRINLNDLTIRDKYGQTAKLNGWLTHKFFKEPSFSFNISDADNLLVYDMPESPGERWYGTVYGNGFAGVEGHPGYVKIGVDITTAPKSKFTFVISDAMQAYDYNFITFRDRDAARKDSVRTVLDATPIAVQTLKQKLLTSGNEDTQSIYDMNIKVDVNENAQVVLVMDPIGGDKINAWGNGNMRLSYNSSNEDLRMFGKYTLTRGTYNFTLQDIIIKDFTIENGSSITFNGNPYAALLDIKAAYSLNANLSDLDESFLQDKELNRTNVPVKAMLLVTGDMRQPDIQYDLNFPTLTSDIYRKVRSIINTEEMMSRQIIYLLALNRFYTPEYMSATKGNELVSMASSTISSQLSNMLGQLSDKWSISPNFRSDRGDFSDMEVDVALSSHLLNNRLLLNGNLGYRDKALNNNSFIGDFDIEYLLNRMGTIRLKAYNHYNDQNYYLKSALTTQGVGVVFKRDFDNLLSFLRPWKHKPAAAPADSTATATAPPSDQSDQSDSDSSN